jgi:hypothetical protein
MMRCAPEFRPSRARIILPHELLNRGLNQNFGYEDDDQLIFGDSSNCVQKVEAPLPLPTAAPPLPAAAKSRAQVNTAKMRARVFAMRAFQSMFGRNQAAESQPMYQSYPTNAQAQAATINGRMPESDNDWALLQQAGYYEPVMGSAGAWQGQMASQGRFVQPETLQHRPSRQLASAPANASGQNNSLMWGGTFGEESSDIDSMLYGRDLKGGTVLGPSGNLEDEWPDLTLIFRPPKSLRECALGTLGTLGPLGRISPGKWIKIVPDSQLPRDGSRWRVLKQVINTGVAFKLGAKEGMRMTEAEQQMKKERIQAEVEQLKGFLLSIARAWEALVEEIETEEISQTPVQTPASPAFFNDGLENHLTASSSRLQEIPQCPVPTRTEFQVKAVATGIVHLFNAMEIPDSRLIDIDVLAHTMSYPWPPGDSKCQILGCQIAGREATTPGQGQGAKPGSVMPAPKDKGRVNCLNNVCAFKMRIAGGGDNVALRIWSNGKTQTSGCKQKDMLLQASRCICSLISAIQDQHKKNPSSTRAVLVGDDKQLALSATELGNLKVLSAPILGSWELGLKKLGWKLEMEKLCEYLQRDEFKDRVLKVRPGPASVWRLDICSRPRSLRT